MLSNRLVLFLMVAVILITGLVSAGAELISGFESEDEARLTGWIQFPYIWRMRGVALAELSVEHVTQGNKCLKMSFSGKNEPSWPGIDKDLPKQDLTGYSSISMDIYNPQDEEIVILYQVTGKKIGTEVQPAEYKGASTLKPGANIVNIPVSTFADQGLDAARTEYIYYYIDSPKANGSLYFDNFRLLKEGEESQSAVVAGKSASISPVDAVKVDNAPVIDGNLDDACWSNSAKIEQFVDIYKATPDAITEQTSARVAYDDENLYIGIICKESNMDKIRANVSEHDSTVYNDDSVELFLQPGSRGTGDYFHFTINSLGTTTDISFRSNMINIAWSPDWQATAKQGQDSWTVELAIPFASLEITPTAGSTWGFNICRHQVSKEEYSAAFPTFAGFHVPARFGDLTGLNVDFRSFCYSLQDLSLGKGKIGPNIARFTLTNSTGKASEVVANLKLTAESGQAATLSQKVSLAPGDKKAVEIPYSLSDKGKHDVQVYIADAETGRTVYAASRNKIVPPEPIVLTVTKPNYDNGIYATQKVKEISADIDLSVDESLLKSGSIRFALANGKKTLRQKTVKLDGKDVVSVSLSAKGMKTGAYSLEVALLDKDGSAVIDEKQQIRKLPPFKGEVRFDENNNMLVDGKPFFPIGLFQVQGAYDLYPEMKEAGMNFVQMYTFVPESFEPYIQKQLDDLHKNGMKLMMQVPQDVVFFWPKDEREEFIKARIDKFGKHPAMAAYYIADEPDTGNPYASPETLREVRDFIKQHDPYHPVSITILFPGRYEEYVGSTDILSGDPYLGWDDEGSKAPMEKVSTAVDAGLAVTKNRKPYWIIPGILDESQYFPQNELERSPNYREIRCETYMALIHGVKGIVYYNLGMHPADWVPEHRGTWHGLKAVTKEMSELTPVLLANRSQKTVGMNPADPAIHFILKEVNKSYYLLAVNSGKEKKKVEFYIPGLKSGTLRVVSEDRTVAVTDGKFADEFGKYEVHVYTTAEKIPQLPTSKQIEAKCEQLDREFEESRKGNLAAAKDVIIEASSISRRATSAVDGIFGSAWVDATPDVYPDWWQIDFRAVKNVRKIVIDSNLVAYDVLAWDNGQWKTVEKVEGSKANRSQEYEKTVHEFAEPLVTDKIRIVTHMAVRDEQALNEIEFYE